MSEKPPPYPTQPASCPPQEHGYPPQQPANPAFVQQQTTVVVGAPTVVCGTGFFAGPTSITCPSCHQTVVTRVSYQSGTLAWLICILLIVFGCWLGCCLIPFCVDGCKDVRHNCPNCGTTVGVYRRI